MRTIIIITILITTSLSFTNCLNKQEMAPEEGVETQSQDTDKQINKITNIIPVTKYKNLIGTWKLVYRGNYGYEFKFYKSYKTIVIVYLNNQSIIFKGVCVVDENSNIQINIYETKNEKKIRRLNLYRGFKKRKSSYLVFNSSIYTQNKRKRLMLKHIKTIIDGSDSEGYFEPVMRLKKL